MTHRPHQSWNIVDRPDLPEYELNKACPVTGEVTGLERHHISPRSAGTRSWWVELEDGTVVGNIVNLSPSAHYRVTVNKARISYEDGLFYWEEAGFKTSLRWQPPTLDDKVDLDIFPKEDPTNIVFARTPQEGEECKLCKRRVPHKKKATSPKTKVASIRVPIGDAETFEELIDAAAEHMGAKAKPHHKWSTIVVGLALILQTPKEQLP